MSREVIRAVSIAFAFMLMTGVLVLIGSRRLENFDAALVGYTFATLFAVFAIAYRYAMWLQRPPTWVYFKRGWQVFLRPRILFHNLIVGIRRLTSSFALNRFIRPRGRSRWAAHLLIMWGCLIAAAITFPLVFGWIHFEPPDSSLNYHMTYVLGIHAVALAEEGPAGSILESLPAGAGILHRIPIESWTDYYTAFLFGFPTLTIHVDSILGKFIFHGLVWASFLVIAGVMLAFRRRMRDHGAVALQQFGEDVLPLLLLFAVSITGLGLWASYTFMDGYAFEFMQITHAVCVIFTLLWLPFGKFFHIFQRPAQIGVAFYKDAGERGEQAQCRRCGERFASLMQVEDLIRVQRQLGYRYEIESGTGAPHYQWICPKCRRLSLGLAQGRLWQAALRPGTVEGRD
ncbi:MAG TPA: MFS transporter [Acidobacteriota bacterium]|nr:MFS transporter [Acidobacteriota bacterium]